LIGLGALGATAARFQRRAPSPPAAVKPPRLRDGDTIALINPVPVPPTEDDVHTAVDALEGLRLRVAPTDRLRRPSPRVSARERAEEINDLFADPSVRGLVALRGGWGCADVLPYLDYAEVRRHPKVVLGFSDVGALLLGLHTMTGLVTFHGPTGISPWSPPTVAQLRSLLFDAARPPLTAAEGTTVVPGRARGRLLGGNLTVLSSLIGSPYVPADPNPVLFLEEVSEPYSEVERMLTQLRLSGLLDHAAAVVFGRCEWCGPPALDRNLTLADVLREQTAYRRIPVFLGAPIGHIRAQLTVPLGIEAEVDAARRVVQLAEPAVAG
jgi:muramoyltetrapeptide carboxypeptidase